MNELRHRWEQLRRRPERGAGGESLELVMIAAAILLLVSFGIASARYATGSSRVAQAATDAARAASLQRDSYDARVAATDTARATLNDAGYDCSTFDITVDASAFNQPQGQPGTIEVTVSCVVEWSDLVIPGVPGRTTLTSTATSPLDVTQERL